MGGNIIFAKPITLDYANKIMTYEPMDPSQADMFHQLLDRSHKIPVVGADIDGGKVRLMFDSGAAIDNSIRINKGYHADFRKLAGDPKAKIDAANSVSFGGKEIESRIPCLLRPFECSVVSSLFFTDHIISIDLQAQKIFPKHNPVNQDTHQKKPRT